MLKILLRANSVVSNSKQDRRRLLSAYRYHQNSSSIDLRKQMLSMGESQQPFKLIRSKKIIRKSKVKPTPGVSQVLPEDFYCQKSKGSPQNSTLAIIQRDYKNLYQAANEFNKETIKTLGTPRGNNDLVNIDTQTVNTPTNQCESQQFVDETEMDDSEVIRTKTYPNNDDQDLPGVETIGGARACRTKAAAAAKSGKKANQKSSDLEKFGQALCLKVRKIRSKHSMSANNRSSEIENSQVSEIAHESGSQL